MIHVIQGFRLSTRDAVDSRLVLTKDEMKSVNDNQMPDTYFAVCKDDNLLYVYDKHRSTYSTSGDTGKFVPYSNNKIETISINGVELPISDLNVEIPLANKNEFGVIKSGKGTDINNGVITLDFNSLDDKIIPFNKINFGELIIDAND